MLPMRLNFVFLCFLLCYGCSSGDTTDTIDPPINEDIYFPPLNSENWETKSIADLNWNNSALQPLLDYLEEKNSKSFIVLHEGKIVVEAYFNGHSETSPWYWASAGKTLTTAVTGIAEEEGLININNKVSDYVGTGWTSAPLAKENLITCRNLLTMTSGLDDSLGDSVDPSNLHFVADAGSRWAYHNVYVKLQDVIAQASNTAWSSYFNLKLRDRIGINGIWIPNNDLSVYWSNTRSMARFGLLIYAKGLWETDQIIPQLFLNDAVNTSQNLNEAYGYMWWLNGKSTFRLPQVQFQFNGELIPNAPNDMYCALGKNDQKIYIVPSKKLVVVRMGEVADGVTFALSDFDDQLWLRLNALVN